MQRIVEVTFVHEAHGEVTERYGPFANNQHLAAWLDEQDEKVTFGSHFTMELEFVGAVTTPVPRTRARRS